LPYDGRSSNSPSWLWMTCSVLSLIARSRPASTACSLVGYELGSLRRPRLSGVPRSTSRRSLKPLYKCQVLRTRGPTGLGEIGWRPLAWARSRVK
jgi:hypothetical protein